MHLIKKYASALSAAAVLAALFAAPYLIPTNPDSPVFRSGVFGFILMLGCGFPIRHSLQHADKRTLVSGLVWGLAFSLALSLGSELFVYNGLLPGLGSLIRRLAVPVLSAPLFGCLCSRLMMLQPCSKLQKQIPFFVFFAVILLSWTPVLLAYWPGMLNYDFVGEYMQHVESSYSSIHPLLHSILMNSIIAIGEKLSSPTFGLLLISLLQMALFAASLAWSCRFANRHHAPLWLLAAMLALYALHPIFSVMSMSMTKDTLFAAAILVQSLETIDMIEAPEAFFKNRRRCAFFILLTINTALMRNNGVFALVLMLPALIIVLRGFRKKAIVLCTASVTATLLTLGALNVILTPESLPSFQLYSLPAQQLVRAYNSGKMSPEDMKELEGWYTSEFGLIVHPHLADGAKGYLDRPRLQTEGSDFLRLWQRNAGICSHEYAEAFLMLNVGSWYPDDLSHSTIYPDASWNDKGYLQTQEYDMNDYGIRNVSLLPRVKAIFEKICRRNEYQEYPIISILFCTATPFWVIAFCYALLIARRENHLLPAILGMMGLWLSYLFGPCTLPRYILPLFACAPAFVCAAFFERKDHA